MPAIEYFTAAAVRAMPDDGNRYELVHGELLVTPSPAPVHQIVLARLTWPLRGYLHGIGIEGPWTSPADISWGEDTLVRPHIFVADIRRAA